MKKVLSFLLSILLIFPVSALFCEAASPVVLKPHIDAKAYLLGEPDTGKILLSSNLKMELPMASTTKIMTALVTNKYANPEETVRIPKEAVGTEGTSAYLRSGEQFTVKELLYALLLSSANDAAVALAIHVGSTIENFVEKMNREAELLHLENTHFKNPHGLEEDGHYSSVYDLFLMTKALLKQPLLQKIVSAKSYCIGKEESRRTLHNHNRLLSMMEGCIGVKTGYTLRAGRCLVSACKRGNTTLVCVTLHCKNDWSSHEQLYSYGFSTVETVYFKKRTLEYPLVGGEKETVLLTTGETSLLLEKGDLFSYEIALPSFLYAPLKKGTCVGNVLIQLGGKEVDQVPITVSEDVYLQKKPGFFLRLFLWMKRLFHRKVHFKSWKN